MDIIRAKSAEGLIEVLRDYPDLVGDPEQAHDWVSDERNILLQCDNDYGLFSYHAKNIHAGHYFFSAARGKKALQLAREMINRYFVDYGGRILQGATPIENRAAIWMNHKIGFTRYDTLEVSGDMCGMFMITADEFWAKNSPFLKIEMKALKNG